MEAASTRERRLSPVTAVFLIVLVDVLGFTIILPLLPYYAKGFGAGPAVVGTLLASYAACQLFSGPFLGRLSDRIGRKPLLLLSQLGTFVGFLILAFAPSLAWLFAGRILDGLTAGNISLAQASLADFTPPEKRARAFSRIGIAFGVGFLIGPALAGWLSRFGYVVPILAGAGLSATSIGATALLLPARPPPAPGAGQRRALKLLDVASFARFFRLPPLRLRLGQFFLFILSFSMYTSCFALFAMKRLRLGGALFGASEVAYVLAYGGLLGIVLQAVLMGPLVDRFGERRLVASGLLSMALGYLIMSQADGLPLALAAATFASLGHGVVRPSLTSLITRSAGRGEQGAVLGVNQSLQSLAQIAAPLIGGALIQRDLTSTWACVAAATAVAASSLPRLLEEGGGAPEA